MNRRDPQDLTSQERVDRWLQRPNRLKSNWVFFVPAILVLLWWLVGIVLWLVGLIGAHVF